jgi:hypothetical protein
MSNGTLRFSTFFDKICPIFHKNDPDPHEKSPKTQNILQIRPKNHQNRPTQKPPPPDFDDFWTELAKYFVFLGIFHGDRGRFYEKLDRFFVKKSRKSESTIAHCYLLMALLASTLRFSTFFGDFSIFFSQFLVKKPQIPPETHKITQIEEYRPKEPIIRSVHIIYRRTHQ